MKTKIVSFYCDVDGSSFYSDCANAMISKCTQLSIPHEIRHRQFGSNWIANVLAKPTFLLEMYNELTQPFLWVDVDCIIGELNYGGDMVRQIIKSAMQTRKGRTQTRKIELVTSSRGKRLRAEPVSALYEDGLVHHVGYFHDLETELVEWVEGKPSPNRLDALVFAITKLSGVKAEVTQERVTGFY